MATLVFRRPLRWLAAGGILAGILGCEAPPRRLSVWSISQTEPASPDCSARNGASPRVTEQTVVLEEAPVYCDIVAVPVVTLEGSVDGTRPEPGRRVVMTSDGRYYTTSRYGHQVLEWNRDGRFRRGVGSVGEGPGEFSPRGGLILLLGARDTLFVLDGNQRWTVFDPALGYVRTFQGRFSGRSDETLHVVGGRGILTTGDVVGRSLDASAGFHWMKFDGSLGASFGPPREGPASEGWREERASAIDGDGLWVTPPDGARRGMALERWTFEGRRTRLLERRVPWLPPDGYPEEPGGPRLPEYDLVHVDGEGLIWIVVAVRDPRWRQVSGEERRSVERELYDGRVEVIDPEAGRVVASYRYDGPPEQMPPVEYAFLHSDHERLLRCRGDARWPIRRRAAASDESPSDSVQSDPRTASGVGYSCPSFLNFQPLVAPVYHVK